MKKLSKMFIVLLLCAFVFTGCSKKTGSDVDPSAKKGTVKDTLVFGDDDVETLDPQYAYEYKSEDQRAIANIFECLIRYDDVTGEIKPAAAESWTISDDGLEYTFKLFKGNKFHNGNELKASDVKFTFERAKESPFVRGMVEIVDRVEVENDYTVKIVLTNPYSPFIKVLGSQSLSIVNEEAIKQAGDMAGKQPIGTGAYKLVQWNPGDKIVLKAYSDYHFGEADIKNIILKVIPDRTTALVSLQIGDLDAMMEVLGSARKTVEASDNLILHDGNSAACDYLMFNVARPPFNDVRVRQAVAKALNLNDILISGTSGDGVIADNMIPSTVFGYTNEVKPYEMDIEGAKALLKDAGYENGLEITMNIWSDTPFVKVGQVIQQNLAQIGITVKLSQLETAAFMDDLTNGDFDITHAWLMFTGADPDKALTQELSSGALGDTNYSGYSNEQVDKLLDEARICLDESKRAEMYKEIIVILHNDVPYIPLFISKANIACNAAVKGVVGRPLTRYYFDEWSWAK